MASDRVKVALGRTLNLGNFESLRVDIELIRDCSVEEGRAAAARSLRGEVETLLKEAVAGYIGELGPVKKSQKN